MNSELKKVEQWSDVNKLSINTAKTNFMIIKSTKKQYMPVNMRMELAILWFTKTILNILIAYYNIIISHIFAHGFPGISELYLILKTLSI